MRGDRELLEKESLHVVVERVFALLTRHEQNHGLDVLVELGLELLDPGRCVHSALHNEDFWLSTLVAKLLQDLVHGRREGLDNLSVTIAMEDAPGLERRLFEHLVLDLAVDVSRGLLDVERVAVTTSLGSHYHSASCVLVALESCRDILERDVPELLLLLTLRIAVEDFKKVAALCDLPVSVGVRDLSEVLHETEVGAHLVGESRHLAELRNQGDLGTGLPVLVNEQGLVGLGDVLVVAGLVVLLVRDLKLIRL